MIHTKIWDRDRETGLPVVIAPDLRDRIEEASKFVEGELTDLAGHFDISVGWRFETTTPGVVDVLLDITTRGGGVTSARHPSAVFFDTPELHRRLRRTLWHFSQILSGIIGRDFDRIRERLHQFVASLGA